MTFWTSHDLSINNTTLRIYRAGDPGSLPLVLLHSFGGGALTWTRTAAALVEDYQVIAYDARGHGASARLTEAFGEAERIGDLAAVIRALRLEQPVLLGHSMGAGTGLRFAAAHPRLLSGLILLEPAWDEATISSADMLGLMGQTLRSMVQRTAAQASTRAALLERLRTEHPNWQREDVEALADAGEQLDPMIRSNYRPDTTPWQVALSRVLCPALLLIGERKYGSLVSTTTADYAQDVCATLNYVTLHGAGHSPHRETFERFITAVRDYVNGLNVQR